MDEPLLRGLLVHTALYSAYNVLFGLSIYVHLKKRSSCRWIHLTFLTVPFFLSSIAYFATVYEVVRFNTGRKPQLKSGDVYSDLVLLLLIQTIHRGTSTVVRICYILSNLIADLYITYRCYIVWGRSIKIVVLPSMLIVAALISQIGIRIDGELTPIAILCGMAMTFITNTLVTMLIAGRIWWVGYKASLLLPDAVLGRYRRTIQVVLESGLLYPAVLLALLATGFTTGLSTSHWNSLVAATLCIVNIAPTLIIIRVGHGVSVDDVESTVRTYKVARLPSSGHDFDSLEGSVTVEICRSVSVSHV